MLHDIPLHWRLSSIWSIYPAGHNPSERRCGVKQVRWERKRNREGRVNRKLQSLEGQQDVPYLEAVLIKDLGWGNVITSGGGEWTETQINEIESDECSGKKKNAIKEGGRTCYIICSFWLLLSPQWNSVGIMEPYCSIHLFVHNISDPQYPWWIKKCWWHVILIHDLFGNDTSFVCLPWKPLYFRSILYSNPGHIGH